MLKEIEYMTNYLINELGKDSNGHELFTADEIVDGKWDGRTWLIGETVIELNYMEKIHLALYPVDYLKKIETIKSKTV